MKTGCLAAMVVMAGVTVCAGRQGTVPNADATVCTDPEPEMLMGVRPMASAMFARIGLTVDWRWSGSCPAGIGAIRVHLLHDSTRVRGSSPRALAFAQPYSGTIVVFLDRIKQVHHSDGPWVLAHVLVHEIAHVLEGIDRHSANGIMKACWTEKDYFEMRRKPLPFAADDVNLIYAGLQGSRSALNTRRVADPVTTSYR